MGWAAAVGRRGVIIAQPPAPSGSFGPTSPLSTGTLQQRVQAVEDGTTPLAVTHPGGSPTVVNPGDNWATKRDAAGAGGVLWVTKGIHTRTAQLSPLANQTWVLESAAGFNRTDANSVVVDGADANFTGFIHNFNAVSNVTIKGGVWQRQGNTSTSETWATAILEGTGGSGNWLVQDAIIKDNWNNGLSFQHANWTARRVYITNNGRTGFSANGTASDGIMDACRLSFNNSRQLDPGATGSDAGTMKLAGATENVVIQRCWIHDNIGFGAWADTIDAGGYKYLDNSVKHNEFAGLFLENIRGGCEIQRNYVYNNGYSTLGIGTVPNAFENKVQIRITGANSTLGTGIRGLVKKNVVDFDLTQDSNRGGAFIIWDHTAGRPDCKNWDITENQWWIRAAFDRRIRGQDTDAAAPNLWDGDIDFIANEYHVVNTSTNFWQWDSGTGTGQPKNYSQWQGFHGGDNLALQLI